MATHQTNPPPAPEDPLSCCGAELRADEVVMDCLTMLAASVQLDTAINAFLEALGCFYGAGQVFLLRLEPGEDALVPAFLWPGAAAPAAVPAEPFLPWLDSLEAEGLLSLSGEDPRLAALCPLCGAQPAAALAAPLYLGAELRGFLCVAAPGQHREETRVLLAIASLCVAELRRLELSREVDFLRHRDPLTGAYNRASYVSSLARCHAAPAPMGVVIASVNGLKQVNAVLGNAFGDSVVQQTAEVMRAQLDTEVYRIGGDEFLALHLGASAGDFQGLVASLRAAFDQEGACSVSVGSAWTDQETDIYQLISLAEQQLADHKRCAPAAALF